MPFGGTRELPNQPTSGLTDYGYTGQRNLDEDLGLMDYKARFYSPVLNRFIQPDTIVPNPVNPQMFNRFSYVVNSPINLNDPSGHVPIDCIGSNYCGSAKDPKYVLDSQFKPKPLKPKPPKEDNIPNCGYHHCPEEVWDVIDAYGLGWQNFGQAWSITTNGNSTWQQWLLASAFITAWVGAHAGLTVGLFMLAAQYQLVAMALNASINVGFDAYLTTSSGGNYTLEQGLSTATFSLAMGGISGKIASTIGTRTATQWLQNVAAQSALQLVGNTVYRRIKEEPTSLMQAVVDVAIGGYSASIQMGNYGNPNTISHLTEAWAGVMYVGVHDDTYPVLIPSP